MHSKSKILAIPDPVLPGLGARATSYDVARLAGVSQSAVSRVFRTGGSVSPATRAKVEYAAAELGYRPSQIARSLITQRSRLVGVVMTERTARNYPDLLHLLGQEIQGTGNRMLLCAVPDDAGAAAAAADLLAFHVDGIVSSASLPRSALEACVRQAVPVVLYNRKPESALVSAVACDHDSAMEALTGHLAAGGLERSAFVSGPRGAPVSADRLAALCEALARRGHPLEAVLYADYSYDGGRALAAAEWRGGAHPATVVCANDAMALGVLDALRFDLGLRVPEDVAVAGFDDVPQASWPTYELTTLRQPVNRLTRAALRLLAEQMGGAEGGGERRLLPAALQIRGSTRPARAKPSEDAS